MRRFLQRTTDGGGDQWGGGGGVRVLGAPWEPFWKGHIGLCPEGPMKTPGEISGCRGSSCKGPEVGEEAVLMLQHGEPEGEGSEWSGAL